MAGGLCSPQEPWLTYFKSLKGYLTSEKPEIRASYFAAMKVVVSNFRSQKPEASATNRRLSGFRCVLCRAAASRGRAGNNQVSCFVGTPIRCAPRATR